MGHHSVAAATGIIYPAEIAPMCCTLFQTLSNRYLL
jgi:hypothetical protein